MKIKWNELSTEKKNQLIAEQVMKGIEDRKYRDNSDMTGTYNPMEDLNDAWQIVQKFGLWYSFKKNFNRSMEVSMGNDLSEGQVVTFVLIVRDGIQLHHYSSEALTLQEAICLASLKAVGIDIEEEE
jgi:Phage ABA sandwich domain